MVPRSTDELLNLLKQAEKDIGDESDSLTQCRDAHRLIGAMDSATRRLAAIRRTAIDMVLGGPTTAAELAADLGVTPTRISQLRTQGPGPERALLAPNATAGGSLTALVFQRREAERGYGAVLDSTREAVDKLARLAASMDLVVETRPVAMHDHLDLNRDNLLVLMGPRTSVLIAQAITADPAIKWRRDQEGRWHIVDIETGNEYFSDFDQVAPGADHSGGKCIAHIGRVRRPDGQGSFLYLGGAHAAGTAGAVQFVVDQIDTLWEQTRKSLWSAAVQTHIGPSGEVTSVKLLTPVYVHGKR
ncbi:hypothetical protein AB0B89_36610, partial [Sphaerisporangium sp. NPDC049002]|uniref:hypothetical protein n=1 Tax=Sphaerisporangium sp. NPDC049002 TaxID=3155392 RepID=UPI00340EE2D4